VISRILHVDFANPHRRVDPQSAISARVEEMPKRLSQTPHRMADTVRDMLCSRVTLCVSYGTGLRSLTAEEVVVFERVLAPCAEVGSALPSDRFVIRLLGSMDRRLLDAEHLGDLAAIRAAWSDDGTAWTMFCSYLLESLQREWTKTFPAVTPTTQVEMWALQLASLLVRPGDVHRLVGISRRCAS
jgi:hypothetical protein